MHKWLIVIFGLLVVVTVISGIGISSALAQETISATPIVISLPSATPPATEQTAFTPTFTRTPTPMGVSLLEAKESAGDINIRTAPDPEAERLGTIQAGEVYPVLGRYYRWLQFQYAASPSGTAWVYDELVNIIGDETNIPEINIFAQPTVDTTLINATLTWEAITQTPGGILTATAVSRVLPAPGDLSESVPAANADNNPSVLPTFTYPPDIPTNPPQNVLDNITATPVSGGMSFAVSDSLPPIVPIIILGGLGLLGLAISSLRR